MDQDKLRKLPKERYIIELNTLRFIIPELIFNPNILGISQGGLIEGINQSIKACHSDYNNLLYENIILSGGNMAFPNFKQRLVNDLVPNSPYDNEVNVFGGKYNRYSVLEGMKIFAEDEEEFTDSMLTKEDYNELGLNIMWKNCL